MSLRLVLLGAMIFCAQHSLFGSNWRVLCGAIAVVMGVWLVFDYFQRKNAEVDLIEVALEAIDAIDPD